MDVHTQFGIKATEEQACHKETDCETKRKTDLQLQIYNNSLRCSSFALSNVKKFTNV